MNIKDWIAKNGLPIAAVLLAGASTLVNNKNSDKKMEETIAKKVEEAFTKNTKGS